MQLPPFGVFLMEDSKSMSDGTDRRHIHPHPPPPCQRHMTAAQGSTPCVRAFLVGTRTSLAVAVLGVAGTGVAAPLPVFVDNSALFLNLGTPHDFLFSLLLYSLITQCKQIPPSNQIGQSLCLLLKSLSQRLP
jgi:hypothetical protein